VPRRVFTVVTTTAIAVGCVLSFPQGVAAWEWPWIAASAAALAALGAALVLACVPLRWRAGIIAAVGVVSIALVGPARDALRYRFYAGAVAARNFDPHPTDQHVAEAWPIWQALDRDTPSTIAFAAGWDRRGHNWYRYPLLGSRLQNHVTYVPVTKDGSIVDYRERDRLLRSVHVPSWLEGLAERRVDTLVLGHPTTIETVIVQQLPALFELEVSAGSNRAYRVDRDRLRRSFEDSRSH
jgi:hypothetical protein